MLKPKWTRWLGATVWYVVSIPITFFVFTMMGAPIEIIDPVPKLSFGLGPNFYSLATFNQAPQVRDANKTVFSKDPSANDVHQDEVWIGPVSKLIEAIVQGTQCLAMQGQDPPGQLNVSNPTLSEHLHGKNAPWANSSILIFDKYFQGENCKQAQALVSLGYIAASDVPWVQDFTVYHPDLQNNTTGSKNPGANIAQSLPVGWPPEIMPSVSALSFERTYWQPAENSWQQYALWGLGAVLALCVLWIVYQLRQLWLASRHKDLLSTVNCKRVFKIGWAITGIAVLHLSLSYAITYFTYGQLAAPTWLATLRLYWPPHEDRIEFLLSGIFILLIAAAMKSGAKLKREQALTV